MAKALTYNEADAAFRHALYHFIVTRGHISCIWDALAIPAMLRRDALITTACACCDSAMELTARRGRLQRAYGLIHFAVPASRWYENIVFT